MESEPHSVGHTTWSNGDFHMWYNLKKSFPEPATYFDMRPHLQDILSPPLVEFENKENSLVWVLSNCNAYNSRESFVKKLMSQIRVDSFGACLRNKNTHTSSRMQGNIELYSKYKFVIAIENSNCEDYITEKLVHSVASGSIMIVAGKNDKPNYAKYLPKNSYINIYDFESVSELVKHLNYLMSNKKAYEKYLWFKKSHTYTREYLKKLQLNELIDLSKKVLGGYENEKEFFDGIVSKEKSENKVCKIARYLSETPRHVVEKEIKEHKMNRPSTSEACLPHGNLASDFV
jgi:hypothetical protein